MIEQPPRLILSYIVDFEIDKISIPAHNFDVCYVKSSKITYNFDTNINDWVAIPTATKALSKIKIVDQQVVNSTVLVNDAELFFEMLANETYRFDIILFINNATAIPDIQFKITSVQVPTDIRYQVEVWQADVGIQLNLHTLANAYDVIFAPNWTVAPNTFCRLQGSVTNGAANATFRVMWAQRVSNATPTVVKQGSSLNIIKLIV